ncbi:hypothetical protein SNE40_005264 [Patella caerulea]|uniref:Uncharacterized protein n=1 Tax=Patella caerulea TaxID=87958 RepID=A0AAN8PX97_PATCE
MDKLTLFLCFVALLLMYTAIRGQQNSQVDNSVKMSRIRQKRANGLLGIRVRLGKSFLGKAWCKHYISAKKKSPRYCFTRRPRWG